jgi:hypothetical protein
MAKISALTAVTTLDSADEFGFNDSGVSKKIAAGFLPGFELDYVQITSPVTISATTAATANTCITGNPVTYDGSTRICIEAFAPYVVTGVTTLSTIEIVLYDGSTELGSLGWHGRADGTRTHISTHLSRRFLTPSAASHTYSIRAWRSASNGTFHAGAGGTSAFFPAYIRITKA